MRKDEPIADIILGNQKEDTKDKQKGASQEKYEQQFDLYLKNMGAIFKYRKLSVLNEKLNSIKP